MKNVKTNIIFFGALSLAFLAIVSIPFNANAYYYTGFVNGNYIGCETDLDSYGNFVGCGNINPSNAVNTNNPIPVIYSSSPASIKAGSGASIITINGYNFISTSSVRFNYSDRPTDFINSKTLKFQLNPSDLDKAGNFTITVANVGPGGGVSNAVKLNVNKNTAVSSNTISNNNTNNNNTFTNTNQEYDYNRYNDTLNNNPSSNLSGNALSANALSSSKGFLPSTFLQWLVIFFLVLFIVILWRKIYVSDKDRAMPLKHA